jgi:hypothetical protein
MYNVLMLKLVLYEVSCTSCISVQYFENMVLQNTPIIYSYPVFCVTLVSILDRITDAMFWYR